VNIDTDFELMLPDSYVNSIEERLLYQKLAEIQSKDELQKFENELVDRFGNLPKEAINLLKSVELKWSAAEIGFDKIVMKNGIFLGYFPDNPQDKFYQSEKFRNIIAYLFKILRSSTERKIGKRRQSIDDEKDAVKNVDEVNVLLNNILG
jgi:transcription-repair coupling factor (superfamily II helicase)